MTSMCKIYQRLSAKYQLHDHEDEEYQTMLARVYADMGFTTEEEQTCLVELIGFSSRRPSDWKGLDSTRRVHLSRWHETNKVTIVRSIDPSYASRLEVVNMYKEVSELKSNWKRKMMDSLQFTATEKAYMDQMKDMNDDTEVMTVVYQFHEANKERIAAFLLKIQPEQMILLSKRLRHLYFALRYKKKVDSQRDLWEKMGFSDTGSQQHLDVLDKLADNTTIAMEPETEAFYQKNKHYVNNYISKNRTAVHLDEKDKTTLDKIRRDLRRKFEEVQQQEEYSSYTMKDTLMAVGFDELDYLYVERFIAVKHKKNEYVEPENYQFIEKGNIAMFEMYNKHITGITSILDMNIDSIYTMKTQKSRDDEKVVQTMVQKMAMVTPTTMMKLVSEANQVFLDYAMTHSDGCRQA
jgi:hypothetical protein